MKGKRVYKRTEDEYEPQQIKFRGEGNRKFLGFLVNGEVDIRMGKIITAKGGVAPRKKNTVAPDQLIKKRENAIKKKDV